MITCDKCGLAYLDANKDDVCPRCGHEQPELKMIFPPASKSNDNKCTCNNNPRANMKLRQYQTYDTNGIESDICLQYWDTDLKIWTDVPFVRIRITEEAKALHDENYK